MTELLKKALAVVAAWPASRQDDLARIALQMERLGAGPYVLSEEELAELRQAWEESERGDFASAGEVAGASALYSVRRVIGNLSAIADYIRKSNPRAATRARDRIELLINRLDDFPHQGAPTEQREIRRLIADPFPYLILYRIKDNDVVILHIRHSRRRPVDLKRL